VAVLGGDVSRVTDGVVLGGYTERVHGWYASFCGGGLIRGGY